MEEFLPENSELYQLIQNNLEKKKMKLFMTKKDAVVLLPPDEQIEVKLKNLSKIGRKKRIHEFLQRHLFVPSPYFLGEYVGFGHSMVDEVTMKKVEGLENRWEVSLKGIKIKLKVTRNETSYGDNFTPLHFWCVDKCVDPQWMELIQNAPFRMMDQERLMNPENEEEFAEFVKVDADEEDLYEKISKFAVGLNQAKILKSQYTVTIQNRFQEFYSLRTNPSISLKRSIWSLLEHQIYDKSMKMLCQPKKDEEFYVLCLELAKLTQEDFGIGMNFRCDQTDSFHILQSLDEFHCAYTKLKCMKNACDILTQSIEVHQKIMTEKGKRSSMSKSSHQAITADDLLPLSAWIVCKAQLRNFPTNLAYIETFKYEELEHGELGFVYVNMMACQGFLKQLKESIPLSKLVKIGRNQKETQETNTMKRKSLNLQKIRTKQNLERDRRSDSSSEDFSPVILPEYINIVDEKKPRGQFLDSLLSSSDDSDD